MLPGFFVFEPDSQSIQIKGFDMPTVTLQHLIIYYCNNSQKTLVRHVVEYGFRWHKPLQMLKSYCKVSKCRNLTISTFPMEMAASYNQLTLVQVL